MTEFGLDRLSLQELRVVENEEVNCSQPLLEGDRGLGLERGDETVHESLGGQIDDRAPLARGGMRDPLEEMGLAEADRRMDVKRTKGGRPAPVVVGHALGGVKGEFVRPPDLEGREGQPPIEGRAGQSIAKGGRRRRSVGRAAFGGTAIAARFGRFGRGLGGGGVFGRRIFGRLERRGTADEYEDLHHRAEFGVERRRDMPDIVRVDPTLEEARRNGKPSLARSDRHQSKTPEPAVEDIVADFRPQARAAAAPCLVERRTAEPALVDAIRIGFVKDIHDCSSGVKVDSRKCGDADEREALDALSLRPGQPACLPTSGGASSARTVQWTFEPVRYIETGPPPRARHRDRGVARPHPGTAQEHQRCAALDPRRTRNSASRRAAKSASTAIEG